MRSITVLGLGEAGSVIARDLIVSGFAVRGWDPDPEVASAHAAIMADSLDVGVEKADLILSVNSMAVSVSVAHSCVPSLERGQLFADLNTASPQTKHEICEIITESGAQFVDVALLGPVPDQGIRTPCLVSGPGAHAYADWLGTLRAQANIIDATPGSASARKLVKSVFMKGLAASISEAMNAASALDCHDWMRSDILSVFSNANHQLLERLLTGSHRHAKRRLDEMTAVVELLEELAVTPHISRACRAWFTEIIEKRPRGPD